MRKGFFVIVTLTLFLNFCSAQSISYYPFASQLSISSNPTLPAWGEVRIQMNSATSALTTELGPMVTVKKTKETLFYVGAGMNVGWFANVINNSSLVKGYYGSVGVRSFPLEKMPKLGFNFEITPYTDSKVQTGLLRAWLGVSYHFGKNRFKK